MILIADDYAAICAALAALEAAKRAPAVMALTPVPDGEKDGYAIADSVPGVRIAPLERSGLAPSSRPQKRRFLN